MSPSGDPAPVARSRRAPGEPSDRAARGGGSPIRLRDGLRDAAIVFIAVRAALFAVSAIAADGLVAVPPGQPPTDSAFPPPSLDGGWHVLFTGTQRQDAAWYLRLATTGYAPNDASAAFFPLYPSAVRAVAWLPGVGPLGAALVVSNAALFGALVVMHAVTRLELGDTATAARATRYLAIFPTAFFFLAPYTESSFLLLSLLAFWWARRDRWGLAAVAAALAALTRSVGVLIAVGLVVEAVQQSREHGRSLVPRLASAGAASLGPLGWFAWWQIRFGDAWAPIDAQRSWERRATAPWGTIADAVEQAWRYRSYWLLDVVVVLLAIVGICLAIRSVRPGYLAYAAASLVLPLLLPFPARPLLSMPRFVAVLFPVAWGYADAVRRRLLPDALVAGVFAGGFALMAALFVAWQYVF